MTKGTLTLDDARKFAGPLAFSLMLKPSGALCNLGCDYCYYLDKASLSSNGGAKMSIELLERCIKAYIEADGSGEVTFNWHGGEPLVMGLDFYREAVRLEHRYAGGKTIHNTLQTNGTLLDDDCARFFRDEGFLIGISIDGPESIHDRFRMDKGGRGTFRRVLSGINLLQKHRVEFNTMSTINSASEGRGLETYLFLKNIGSRYMQFMPVVEYIQPGAGRPVMVPPHTEGSVKAPWCVEAGQFGRFLCDIFDYWVRNDVGAVFVNHFDSELANWCGLRPGTCAYCETCGDSIVIEHNGDVYSCDHFVYPEYRLGNIMTDDLARMMRSPAQLRFGTDKHDTLPRQCLKCRYLFACRGECPKHRFDSDRRDGRGLNALCMGYRTFFSHISPYMDRMRELIASGFPPRAIIPWARMH